MRAVNLLPKEVKRQRKRPSPVAQLAIVSPFLVGSLVAAGYLLSSSKVNDKRTTLDALQAEVAALPAPKPQQPTNAALAVERDQRIGALGTALQGRLAWDRILRDISAVLPSDVWLTTLSAQAPAPPAPPATTTPSSGTPAPAPAPTATPMSIVGYTYSQEGVARLLTRLAVIPDLQGVKLISSVQTSVAGRDVYSFSIQAGIKPEVTG